MAFFGKYRGEVVDIDDPEKRGRIKVNCPAVLGEQLSRWALPSFPPNTFTVPQKGELVWMEFEEGKADSPIWTGVFYTQEQWLDKFNQEPYEPKDLVTISDSSKAYTEKLHLVESKKDIKEEADLNIHRKAGVGVKDEAPEVHHN